MSADNTKKLNLLIEQQQSLIDELRRQAEELESTDIMAQNESLSKALTKSEEKLSAIESDNKELEKELSTAKQALFAKLADEKLNAFLNTQKKIDSLYYSQANSLGNRLSIYEKQCADNINQAVAKIERYGSKQFGDIKARLEQLSSELDARSKSVRAYYNDEMQATLDKNNALGSQLYKEPLQDVEKQGALKHKSFESFVGLNILSKAGILLFLVGIVMLGRFTYIHLSDIFKEGMIFLLGAVLIGVGEVFFKKEKSVFSTVLISGGIAVLYAAAATGYFAFSLYSSSATFIICVAITALAMFLSNQVKSQVVCAFGAVGGYLPVVVSYMIGFGKAASDATFLPVSCIYFTLLAIVVFIMSYNKRWHIARFVGYALQIVSVGGVALSAWAVKGLNGYSYALPLALAFAGISFLIYLMYPAYLIIKNKPASIYDNVLLALNTVSGAVSLSFTIRNCLYRLPALADEAVGAVFLVLTFIYVALSLNFFKGKSEKHSVSTVISAVSALVFSMLAVPLMFGFEFAPIAWAIEGAAIAYISIEREHRYSEYAGLMCMILSAVAYCIANFGMADYGQTLSLISFVIVVFAFCVYIVRGLIENDENKLYMLLEILNSIASVLLLNHIVNMISEAKFVTLTSYFTQDALTLLFCLGIAASIRFGVLKNKASLIFSDLAGIALVIGVIALNFTSYDDVYDFYYEYAPDTWLSVVNLILLLILVVGTEFFFSICAAHLISKFKAPAWLFTASVSATSLAVITATLMRQFSLPFASVIISAVYIATACVLLAVGFKKDYTVVRSGGLVLILAAFAKLCFVDTAKLDSGWKIASYFAFGAILIVISYFYQRFTKKLEKNAEKLIDDSSDAE